MRSRLIPATAVVVVGALLAWTAVSVGTAIDVQAQDKTAEKPTSRYEGLANLPFEAGLPVEGGQSHAAGRAFVSAGRAELLVGATGDQHVGR